MEKVTKKHVGKTVRLVYDSGHGQFVGRVEYVRAGRMTIVDGLYYHAELTVSHWRVIEVLS